MITLKSPLSELKQVGAAKLTKLKRLGITDIASLLFYTPFRYENYVQRDIASLQPGETANITGTVEIISNRRARQRKMIITEAIVNDGTGTIKATWFNQPFLAKNIENGDEISLAGLVQENWGQLAMTSPQYEKVSSGDKLHTSGLIPIYHSLEALSQKQWRAMIAQVLPLAAKLPDWLPDLIRKELGLPTLPEAITHIHFPKDKNELEQARKRLAFGELFLRQLKMAAIKQEFSTLKAIPMAFAEEAVKALVDSLPFPLTQAQRRSAWEIIGDLKKSQPMNRLLQGDVGSGKTVVAAIAALNVIRNGYQAALMAPTEILAKQHAASLKKILSPFDISVTILTRTSKEAPGDFIIGTQALIQEKVSFDRLGLVIVDEQHRFGVGQREEMLAKHRAKDSISPHFLSMTATPIPRSLALTIYGDLDLSLIDQMPPGRKKIITKIVRGDERNKAYEFMREQMDKGGQVFVVCPLIDPSDKLGVKSAKEEYERLGKGEFAGYKISFLHGQMKPREKDKAMADFAQKKSQIMVSTSVIEVGIDIPEATVMAIEGASRFGLSQLHQFRGRVGRGDKQSYCLLFEDEEIGSKKTKDRLEALEKYDDGRKLAEIDLKMRGYGRIHGLEQSGFDELRIASIFDYEMIRQAREAAYKIISADPSLKRFPKLKAKLKDLYEFPLHLE